MKKILGLVIILLFTISCNEFVIYDKYCSKGTIRVLDKDSTSCAGGGYCAWKMYLYDGKQALWYNTDEKTSRSYKINDTLPTIVLTIYKQSKN